MEERQTKKVTPSMKEEIKKIRNELERENSYFIGALNSSIPV